MLFTEYPDELRGLIVDLVKKQNLQEIMVEVSKTMNHLKNEFPGAIEDTDQDALHVHI